MNTDEILFEIPLQRLNFYLKLSGLHLVEENRGKRFVERIPSRWLIILNLTIYIFNLFGIIGWFLQSVYTHENLIEITYPAACSAQILLSHVKTYYYLQQEEKVNTLMKTLRDIKSMSKMFGQLSGELEKEFLSRIVILTTVHKVQFWMIVIGCAGFLMVPCITMALAYSTTGEFELLMPFNILYPFNMFDIRIYPWVYIYQIYTTYFIILLVLMADTMYYFSSTYIQIQFRILEYDMKRIVKRNLNETGNAVKDTFWPDFVLLIERHRKLISCVTLLDGVYTKSTLFNVMTSSFLICLTGWNITANSNLQMLMPFASFLLTSANQTFWLCYYGDSIMRSSTDFSNAVYNCQWYNVEAKVAKDLLIILTRAQRPCKLTAYGFADVNLATFMRILSTAWSYFALLNTVQA